MENRISRTEFNVIQTAFRVRFDYFENKDIHFNIYDVNSIFDEHIEFGINWAAIGTVSPEETAKFANSLLEASKVVERVNSLNLILDLDLESEIKTKEQFEAAVKMFINKYLY